MNTTSDPIMPYHSRHNVNLDGLRLIGEESPLRDHFVSPDSVTDDSGNLDVLKGRKGSQRRSTYSPAVRELSRMSTFKTGGAYLPNGETGYQLPKSSKMPGSFPAGTAGTNMTSRGSQHKKDLVRRMHWTAQDLVIARF